MNTRSTYSAILILILLSLASCKPALKVQHRGGYLLVQNTIKNKNTYLPTDELEGFIQQSSMKGGITPYFRPGIYFYERSLRGKENNFKLWVRRTFGTKPVILDTIQILITSDKLQQYLKNKGFVKKRSNIKLVIQKNGVRIRSHQANRGM